jgi:hypothetical protein
MSNNQSKIEDISEFLELNDQALEEIKSKSPELSTAIKSVVNALFTTYMGVEPTPEPSKEDGDKIVYQITRIGGVKQALKKANTFKSLQKQIADTKPQMIKGVSTPYEISVYKSMNAKHLEFVFGVDVGIDIKNYNPENNLLQYVRTQSDNVFEDIMKLAGFDYSLSQTFYNALKNKKMNKPNPDKLQFTASGGDGGGVATFYLHSLLPGDSMGPKSYSPFAGMYTYRLIGSWLSTQGINLINTVGEDPFTVLSLSRLSFTSEQINDLLDGKSIKLMPQTKVFEENTEWGLDVWYNGSVKLYDPNPEPSPPTHSNYDSVYPGFYPKPAQNDGSRKGPTQSAKEYFNILSSNPAMINDTYFDPDDIIDLKGEDARFIVKGNDGNNYTLSTMSGNGVTRWIKARIGKDEVEENIANEFGKQKDYSTMTLSQLKELLKDSKEALSIFDPKEPEYKELMNEIDDIESVINNIT